VSLVELGAVANVERELQRAFARRFGRQLVTFVSGAAAGMRELGEKGA
jgi:hypothetical protein